MIISKIGNDFSTIMPDERSARIMSEVMKMMVSEHGKRVLDIGCGDGTVAFILNGMGMKVTGVDRSHENIVKARAKDVDAVEINAENLFFDKEFDVAFSINALHKMRHPTMVLDSVYRALVPEGRFIGEIAGDGNDGPLNNAILKVLAEREKNGLYIFDYYQPSTDDYREKLESKGFWIRNMETVSFAISLPDEVDEWLDGKLKPFQDALFDNDGVRSKFFNEVKEELLSGLRKENGKYQLPQNSIIFYAIKKENDV